MASAIQSVKGKNLIYWVKWAVCVAVLLAFSFMTPFEGLEVPAMRCLAVLCFVVLVMVFQLTTDFIASLMGFFLFYILKVGETTAACLSGFTTGTFLLLLGAFGMGGVLAQCGSLAHLARVIVAKFPNTFKGRVSAMYVSGMLVSPFLSSGSAKGVIMSLISVPCAKNMGYKQGSNAAAGMFMAGWIPVGVLGVCFLSGCMSAPTLTGLVDAEYAGSFTWVNWFLQALPFLIVTLVGCYFATLFMYKPKAGDMIEGFVAAETAEEAPAEKLNGKQTISLVVLGVVVICWIFAKKIGLQDAWVAVGGLTVMLLAGCIDKKKGAGAVPWNVLIFSCWVLTVSSLMGSTGLSNWLTDAAGAFVAPLMSNLWIFIPVCCVVIYVIRLLVISQTLVTSVFFVLLAPLAVANGINPWIVGFIASVTICTWNTLPQSIPFLSAFGACDGYVPFGKCVKMSVFVMIWQIVALLASIPFWSMMGLC